MKEALTNTKRDLQKGTTKEAELRNRLSLVENQLKEKEEFYQNYKSKNWDENQRTLGTLRKKYEDLEREYR
jgi:hypothetical protein